MENLGNIGIIGAGNMGKCLLSGFAQQGYPLEQIYVAAHTLEKAQQFIQQGFRHSSADNAFVAARSDILLLAVKPAVLKLVVQEIAPLLSAHTLLISVVAGITTRQIQQWLGNSNTPIIRAMPNAPALYNQGITGLFASHQVNVAQRAQAELLLKAVGEIVWIEPEPLMDVVTALSGSGPGYFFYIMAALQQGAINLGLSPEIASKLTLYTALGSATMALAKPLDLDALQRTVTSPGGTTQEGIKVLKDGKLTSLLENALRAAALRGKTLSEQYD